MSSGTCGRRDGRRSWRVFVQAKGAPPTTLNTPVGPRRVLALLRPRSRRGEAVPVGASASNPALSILAFSYDGCLVITVRADAGHFTDLDVLIDGMARDWQALIGVT